MDDDSPAGRARLVRRLEQTPEGRRTLDRARPQRVRQRTHQAHQQAMATCGPEPAAPRIARVLARWGPEAVQGPLPAREAWPLYYAWLRDLGLGWRAPVGRGPHAGGRLPEGGYWTLVLHLNETATLARVPSLPPHLRRLYRPGAL